MKEMEMVELLNVHAEGLKDGVDLTEELIAKKPAEDQRALTALLGLARRVQAALAPVEPRPAFVSGLRLQLRDDARAPRPVTGQRRRWIELAAGLAGILYLAGLLMVSWRLSVAILGLIAGLLGVRLARPAVPRIRLGD